MEIQKKSIVIAVTGSIAAYRACELTRNLSKAGYPVRVMMTKNAEYFVGSATFQALSGRRVYTNNWDEGMIHMDVKQEAALFAVVPATANIIGKFAAGIADDVVSSSFLAVKCPVIIAPSMNPGMYASRAVQRNLALLKSDGILFIDPKDGEAVDGETGPGKLADISVIENFLIKLYQKETGFSPAV